MPMTRARCPMAKVILVGSLLLLLARSRSLSELRADAEQRNGNTDIYLPVTRDVPIFGQLRELLHYWLRIGPDDIVVVSSQYMVRLHKGRVVWTQRFRATRAAGTLWNDSATACFSPNGVIVVIHRVKHDAAAPAMVVVSVVSPGTGRLLSQTRYWSPEDTDSQVLTMIPWRNGASVLFGHPGSSDPPVEWVMRIRWDGSRIEVSYADPVGVKGWWYLGEPRRPGLRSVVLARTMRGKHEGRLKILRSPNRVRSVAPPPAHRFRFLLWATVDEPTGTLFLYDNRQVGGGLIAYDLRTGQRRWRSPFPWVPSGPGRLTCQDDRVIVAGKRGRREEIVMLDRRTGVVTSTLEGPAAFGLSWHVDLRFHRGEELFVADWGTHSENAIEYVIRRRRGEQGKPRVVASVRIVEWIARCGPKGVSFLLPASDGYWLGLPCGIIAYRKHGSSAPARRIQLEHVEMRRPGKDRSGGADRSHR